MSSTIPKDDLFRAILALDVYHRGYNSALGLPEATGTGIGTATVGRPSSAEGPNQEPGVLIGGSGDDRSIGFYALEYDWNGQTVVAYRGTDDDFADGAASDAVNGFGFGAGVLDGHRPQVSSRGSKARPGT